MSPKPSSLVALSHSLPARAAVEFGDCGGGNQRSLAPQTDRAHFQSWRTAGGKAYFLTVWLNGTAIRGK